MRVKLPIEITLPVTLIGVYMYQYMVAMKRKEQRHDMLREKYFPEKINKNIVILSRLICIRKKYVEMSKMLW